MEQLAAGYDAALDRAAGIELPGPSEPPVLRVA
jgi:hypothetical protein